MSGLQEQAVQMISSLSDENVSFLIEIIQRLMPEKRKDADDRMQAFYRLNAVSEEIGQYLPEDFDPDRELEEARKERYGCDD